MLKRQKLNLAFYKFLCFVGFLFLANHFHLFAANLFPTHDTDAYQVGGIVGGTSEEEMSLFAPLSDLYSYWDTMNLDPYAFSLTSLTGTFNVPILESDCGFMLPFTGVVTSGYGWRWGRMHQGVDIQLKTGDSVYCAFDGVVRMSRWYYGYGNLVVVRHHNGMETLYGHLSKRTVSPGDMVNAGQLLGLGGSTGYSTGPHLHFETRFMGKAFNPESIIDFTHDSLKTDTLAVCANLFASPKPVYKGYYRGKSRNNVRKGTAYRRRY